MDRAQAAAATAPGSGDKLKKRPTPPPAGVIADIPLVPGDEVNMAVSDMPGPTAPGKLKKGKGPAGFSPEEEAVEDAKRLAGGSFCQSLASN